MPNFPRIEIPEFKLPEFKLPEFKLPDFKLPEFDLPQVELPDVELPTPEQVVGWARDAAYAGVGLVVMTAERIQELQEQLLETFKTQVTEAAEQVRANVDRVAELIKR
jgi:hypothetical protein